MGLSTLSQVREWVAPAYGRCDDDATRAVNKIRQYIYSMYQKLNVIPDVTECFAVHRFDGQCNGTNEDFLGLTLPRDCQTVEAAWFNSWPIRLQSSWREFQRGITDECACGLEKFDIAGYFPTALDVTPRHPSKLFVKVLDERDIGKRFLIRGTATTSQPFSQEFKLTTELQETGSPLATVERNGGIVKEMTVGRVVLLDQNSRLIGMYEPDETIPSYRRIKITGLPSGCDVVNIRASRKFFPLYGDDDVVELDNAVVFDSMARYLRIFEKAEKSASDRQDMAVYYSTAQQMLDGDKSREIGKSTQGALQISTPSFGGSRGQRLNRIGGLGVARW